MRSKLKEFYHPDKKDLLDLKNSAIFIFDACALLELYKISPSSRNSIFKILTNLHRKNRLWQPHQFCYEYHFRRQNVIKEEAGSYNKIIKEFENYFESIKKAKLSNSFPNHPYVKNKTLSAKIKKELTKLQNTTIKLIEEKRDKHPNLTKNDHILVKLTKLFDNNTGNEFTAGELDNIYKQGEKRYKKYLPPGYMDVDKDDEDPTKRRKYGDLVAWFQIINQAKLVNKPIVLVTLDSKEDWWWLDKKTQKHGPRKELVKEMYEQAGVYFHMMDIKDLLDFAKDNLGISLTKALIEGMEKITEDSFLADANNELFDQSSSSVSVVSPTVDQMTPTENSTITNEMLMADNGVVGESTPNFPEIQI